MASPAPAPAGERTVSGTAFAISAIVACVLLVAFVLFVSPVLLDRTLERVPPPAPHTVARAGSWEAVAVQADEDTGCLEVRQAGETSIVCASVRGAPLRVLDAVPAGGGVVVHGIVDPRTTAVELELVDGASVQPAVAYVDFGFPLGFFATELEPGAAVARVLAYDRADQPRAQATCAGGLPPQDACTITDLR